MKAEDEKWQGIFDLNVRVCFHFWQAFPSTDSSSKKKQHCPHEEQSAGFAIEVLLVIRAPHKPVL